MYFVTQAMFPPETKKKRRVNHKNDQSSDQLKYRVVLAAFDAVQVAIHYAVSLVLVAFGVVLQGQRAFWVN